MTPYEQQAEKIAVALEQEGLLNLAEFNDFDARKVVKQSTPVIARILTESASGEGGRDADRRRRAQVLEPESMSVGQLNQAVRDLREENYQLRLLLQATTEQANRPEPDVDWRDRIRQPLQVIRSESDNVRKMTGSCPGHSQGQMRPSFDAIDRAVLRIDAIMTEAQPAAEPEVVAEPTPPHRMRLVDTCYGMTGGDLYACDLCGSRAVVRAEAIKPRCPATKAVHPTIEPTESR